MPSTLTVITTIMITGIGDIIEHFLLANPFSWKI